ncbi:hypothetical protein NEPAR06_0683 [Nematocida parisii]|uniref:Uncharacterized protein n=1 Tax=Nematocida parisii (strain ERTm3) TaxID=935791 RepID=I3EHX4_NEMP3|nr:uncharacterized protein NEPG_02420 [Nematocida parisii ERTm1]EIJ88821.1 hypothetical protein NEQG_00640 [Nematocida parisii ERTm3]KAI5143046.1 hypothetical protein NEPAR07_0462 [Nematocida parisii]EIJ92729.1 hypothetical protein NEPG_02420 [Nematocida parisii ERTm1]KAI5153725.1 hypothetical protein NEPAR06_0683 [Nematocida parisii]KAI5156162.1 hypothetical protein NEPAR05_0339 [Nematocida parisii]|eukprot:XP_013060247.1 hypothetical protein NEPG_02420 [Nematocida parisii ERTm1]
MVCISSNRLCKNKSKRDNKLRIPDDPSPVHTSECMDSCSFIKSDIESAPSICQEVSDSVRRELPNESAIHEYSNITKNLENTAEYNQTRSNSENNYMKEKLVHTECEQNNYAGINSTANTQENISYTKDISSNIIINSMCSAGNRVECGSRENNTLENNGKDKNLKIGSKLEITALEEDNSHSIPEKLNISEILGMSGLLDVLGMSYYYTALEDNKTTENNNENIRESQIRNTICPIDISVLNTLKENYNMSTPDDNRVHINYNSIYYNIPKTVYNIISVCGYFCIYYGGYLLSHILSITGRVNNTFNGNKAMKYILYSAIIYLIYSVLYTVIRCIYYIIYTVYYIFDIVVVFILLFNILRRIFTGDN